MDEQRTRTNRSDTRSRRDASWRRTTLALLAVGALCGTAVTQGSAPASAKAKAKPKAAKAVAAPLNASTIAVLRVPKAKVLRLAAAGKAFAPSADGTGLSIGDRLRTDAKGVGYVELADGSVLRLAGTADVSVADLVMSAANRRVKFNLVSGNVYGRVATASGATTEWSVTTPAGVVSTTTAGSFSVSCTKTGCTVAVAAGKVTVTNSAGTVDVNAGSQTVVVPGQAPTAPKPIDQTVDATKGVWLLCNAARDAVVAPNIAFPNPTAKDCLLALGTLLGPVPGFVFAPLLAPVAAAPTTTFVAAAAPPPSAPPTTFPTRPSFWTGTGGLTATIIQNPFKCDGPPARPYVTYEGLVPGESLTWVWGLAGQPPIQKGTSNAGSGTGGFSVWNCTAALAGTVWTFTMTGGSGHSITYDLVLAAP